MTTFTIFLGRFARRVEHDAYFSVRALSFAVKNEPKKKKKKTGPASRLFDPLQEIRFVVVIRYIHQ